MSGEAAALSRGEADGFRRALLSWYDRHRRVLPWRALPGERPDPYRVWLSEIMLQQTVVAAVIPYFGKFVENWPTVEKLAAAPREKVMDAWAGLGYYTRARKLHECAGIVASRHGGKFPESEDDLKTLPGIGPYTSAAITAIAFDRPATVVDGNVERVVARYFSVRDPLPGAKKKLRALASLFSQDRADRPGDFAQAMMDLGATVCIPKAPRCSACPVAGQCRGRAAGIADELPRRSAKKEKPQRHGHVYWLENGRGQVLVERRGGTGLLAGMLGLPTSDWVEKGENPPPHPGFLRRCALDSRGGRFRVDHVFTHFSLVLTGHFGTLPEGAAPADVAYFWMDREARELKDMPAVFGKFVRLAAAGRESR